MQRAETGRFPLVILGVIPGRARAERLPVLIDYTLFIFVNK
jgi:hypothetical protein